MSASAENLPPPDDLDFLTEEGRTEITSWRDKQAAENSGAKPVRSQRVIELSQTIGLLPIKDVIDSIAAPHRKTVPPGKKNFSRSRGLGIYGKNRRINNY